MFRRNLSPLKGVHIATPCTADWEEMYGDVRVRFCADCKLNVYNLSAMKRVEAERLIATYEGRLCVRFLRRADGTILTNDCPVGLRAVKQRVSRAVTALLSCIFGASVGAGAERLWGGTAEASPSASADAQSPKPQAAMHLGAPPIPLMGGAVPAPVIDEELRPSREPAVQARSRRSRAASRTSGARTARK